MIKKITPKLKLQGVSKPKIKIQILHLSLTNILHLPSDISFSSPSAAVCSYRSYS